MKHFLTLWVLITGTFGIALSQSKSGFDVPANFNYGQKIRIDLGKGNSVMVYLSDVADVPRLLASDSMIQRFFLDLAPIKDSLSDPLQAYYVDYFSDGLGVRKIRYRKIPRETSAYLVMPNEVAAIKQQQDTVRFLGIIPHPAPVQAHKFNRNYPRYYEFIFTVNNISDLNNYTDSTIAQKLQYYAKNKNTKWERNWSGGLSWKMKQEESITGDRRTGGSYNSRDYISFQLNVSVQNYKNYFTPGFGVGTTVVLSNIDRTWRHFISLHWEPSFMFARDQHDKLQTYRNDFLTLGYGQGPVKDKDPMKTVSFTGLGSLGYLIHRSGDFYEKNTFRLSLGRLNLHKTAIDPTIYFNDFFQGVTPGLRIIQFF
ncbi:hypothetical protein [Flavihumibacter petaseus]|uniref:Uncharacterized protein n=1 Tax=Flavihumibacter petaseus NBRC 106054 TaxID=1220578 RepID=A0A0E9N5C1_9BACT|nr:hypothetical protein [Flavihumibacter petaseus]GAO45019.1 hypothetical protein FPE01S_04_02620 [Flavihumibacter petaseus NBRC 106054]